jgi:hypothetical protein
MGVNRIVMQNGVVWWLPPLRSKDEADRATPRSPRRARKNGPRQAPPQAPRDAAATPPAGFVPLSSLGIPGIDSIMLSHADFYRDAYDSAVRDRRNGDADPPRSADPLPDPIPRPDDGPGSSGDEGRVVW